MFHFIDFFFPKYAALAKSTSILDLTTHVFIYTTWYVIPLTTALAILACRTIPLSYTFTKVLARIRTNEES